VRGRGSDRSSKSFMASIVATTALALLGEGQRQRSWKAALGMCKDKDRLIQTELPSASLSLRPMSLCLRPMSPSIYLSLSRSLSLLCLSLLCEDKGSVRQSIFITELLRFNARWLRGRETLVSGSLLVS
jgi:hypothetical protein